VGKWGVLCGLLTDRKKRERERERERGRKKTKRLITARKKNTSLRGQDKIERRLAGFPVVFV